MKWNNKILPLIGGFGLLAFTISGLAEPPEGKGGGGRHEETSSKAELYNFNLGDCNTNECYALGSDRGETGSSVYRDARLEDPDDPDAEKHCALVIATTIDKESARVNFWVPNPNSEDNCGDMHQPRMLRIWQPASGNEWEKNPRLDFNKSNGVEDIETLYQVRLQIWGLYKPLDVQEMPGEVTVTLATGPFRITYQDFAATVVVDPADSDIRTVMVDDSVASICEWQQVAKGKGNAKQDVCVDVGGEEGGIRLPFKVTVTRVPPQ